MTLPSQRVPFPVEPSFRIRPDMHRWPADDRGHLRLDERYPGYLAEKLRLLSADPSGVRVISPEADPQRLRLALVRVAEAFAREPSPLAAGGEQAPAEGAATRPVAADERRLRFPLLGVELDRDDLTLVPAGAAPPAAAGARAPDAGRGARSASAADPRSVLPESLRARARAHLEALGPLERLADALALAVQEDLVIMRGDPSDGGTAAARAAEPRAAAPSAAVAAGAPGSPRPAGRAELLHVSFPSAWDPAARAGADFGALHAPVPHGEVLARAAPNLVRAMLSKGPFLRYVWSLVPDGRLDRNPRRQADLRAEVAPEALWFRVERQTVMPIPELARALFTIRVYATPLRRVLTSAVRRRRLAEAVASMDEALLAYKGIGATRDALLAWLAQPGAPTAR